MRSFSGNCGLPFSFAVISADSLSEASLRCQRKPYQSVASSGCVATLQLGGFGKCALKFCFGHLKRIGRWSIARRAHRFNTSEMSTSVNSVGDPPLFPPPPYSHSLRPCHTANRSINHRPQAWVPAPNRATRLTTNLKSCSYCLRPTTRPFMNNQEPELNPKPDETASAKTNESIQRERSELPVDQQSSYLRSRQIALKKFSPQGGDPS